jgi:hypothetical protein
MTEDRNTKLTWANCIATLYPTALNKIITVFNDNHNTKQLSDLVSEAVYNAKIFRKLPFKF